MKHINQMVTTGTIVLMLVLLAPMTYGAETARVSVSTGNLQGNNNSFLPDLNENGRFVTYYSLSTNLVPGDTNGVRDIFVYDRQTQQTTRVSVATNGGQANGESLEPAISANGRYVAFRSAATNLVPGDTNGTIDVFVHDRQTGITSRVSVATGGGQSNNNSFSPVLSADGRFVAFHSFANNLVPGDTNGVLDVFVHDRQTGTTTRVSVATGAIQGNNTSRAGFLSANGGLVAFESDATNLVPGDTNGVRDLFIHDRQTRVTARVSVATGGGQVNGESVDAELSADGRYVTFQSDATNLVAGDTNGVGDVFVHDRQTNTTTRVSVASGGLQGGGESSEGTISGDGRFVAFLSFATNLVPGDTNGEGDVFVHDRQTNTTTRMSVTTGGVQGNDFSCNPAISQDGRIVGFFSDSTNLVPGDTNAIRDIFIHNRTVNFDLDGDGKADIVWRNINNGSTAIWFMNGTAIAFPSFPGGVPPAWEITGIGDVNADGKADVVWRNSTSGTVAVWLMNGNTIASVGFPGTVPTGWVLEQLGDVDGNGTADLVWRNINSKVVVVWLMNGATIAQSKSLGGVPGEWKIVGMGDVNADRKADIIWRNSNSGAVAVWLMNGLSVLSIGVPGSASLVFEVAGVGDVDGNGTADVIWRNTGTGGVAFWLMNGLTLGSTGALAGKALEWDIAQVSDRDGSGKVDLTWFNTDTGEVEVWLMNGVTVGSTGSPGTTSPSWEIQ
ncbi:FG-GAP-like repeat-containing protein [Candidatus Nitrospira allomarina]|uniref:FG-GAP-like repeat-containing protein n=1 Tax=Candidatus Nitrospira allomarina TaxID=3020900 RepID=A0AA96GCD2_9BACT|nr:FG-GAP-like repeat-containing protein [Candidatus Nitrospira allomarina]WNM56478.1 FG-GAP-like repeat-containing protein [Candidatus Nitrospira allomarina]